MNVTQETKDELRRLMAEMLAAEADYAAAPREPFRNTTDRPIVLRLGNARGEFRRAITHHLFPLLDALAAAEAERDRLRAACEAYAQFAYATDAELSAAGTTRLDVLAKATALERGDAP